MLCPRRSSSGRRRSSDRPAHPVRRRQTFSPRASQRRTTPRHGAPRHGRVPRTNGSGDRDDDTASVGAPRRRGSRAGVPQRARLSPLVPSTRGAHPHRRSQAMGRARRCRSRGRDASCAGLRARPGERRPRGRGRGLGAHADARSGSPLTRRRAHLDMTIETRREPGSRAACRRPRALHDACASRRRPTSWPDLALAAPTKKTARS